MTSRKAGRITSAREGAQAAVQGGLPGGAALGDSRCGPRGAPSRHPRGAGSRPAEMPAARAAKTIPAGGASARGSRSGKPGRAELLAGIAAAEAPVALKAPVKRGAYKTASKTDPRRLDELKLKLGDPDYMDGAILRIATVLSARLTLR